MRREWLVTLGLLGWFGCSSNDNTPDATTAPGSAGAAGGANVSAGGSAVSAGGPGMAASGASGAGVPASGAGKPGVDGGASSAGTAGAAGAGGVGLGVACTGEATYSVTVNITWADAAVGGKHFTTVIGAVRSAALDVWHPGGLATPGVRQMAESGGTETLSAEVQAAINEGTALSIVTFSGGNPPASSMGQILVNAQFRESQKTARPCRSGSVRATPH